MGPEMTKKTRTKGLTSTLLRASLELSRAINCPICDGARLNNPIAADKVQIGSKEVHKLNGPRREFSAYCLNNGSINHYLPLRLLDLLLLLLVQRISNVEPFP